MSTSDTTAPEPVGLKAKARKLAEPAVARVRQELVRAAADDQAGLRAEVAELRAELARQRAEHAAEIAAIHEELAGRADGAGPDAAS